MARFPNIAINGWGRIGRDVQRATHVAVDDFNIVAVNYMCGTDALAHLQNYDSVHGVRPGCIERILHRCSTDRTEALPATFCATGAKSPSAAAALRRIPSPFGVPHPSALGTVHAAELAPNMHDIITNAAWATNCLAPLDKAIQATLGVIHDRMATIHADTNDQGILGQPHKYLRRTRVAALSMIPTATGVAESLGEGLPVPEGRIDDRATSVVTERTWFPMTLLPGDCALASLLAVKQGKAVSHAQTEAPDCEATDGAILADGGRGVLPQHGSSSLRSRRSLQPETGAPAGEGSLDSACCPAARASAPLRTVAERPRSPGLRSGDGVQAPFAIHLVGIRQFGLGALVGHGPGTGQRAAGGGPGAGVSRRHECCVGLGIKALRPRDAHDQAGDAATGLGQPHVAPPPTPGQRESLAEGTAPGRAAHRTFGWEAADLGAAA